MRRLALAAALLLSLLALSTPTEARGGGGGHGGSHGGGSHSSYRSSGSGHSSHTGGSHHHSSTSHHGGGHHKAVGVARSSHGRIKRSARAKDAFKRSHPCPSTGRSGGACPGYVIDHVRALKHGGADDPSNMQWQTVEQAKEKDKWE